MNTTKRAAHFLLIPELAYSPPNDAIVKALLENGYQVDVYSPGPVPDVSAYGPDVSCHPVEYGRRWLLRNAGSRRWKQYDVFSATAEEPFATVGSLARLHGRPSFLLVDEIKSGSYYGDDPEYLKRMHRWAMREAKFCIVNDQSRVKLLQDYAGITDASRIMVYPGCFRQPPMPADRLALRQQWGMHEDDLVICVSGGFNETAGAGWLLDAFCRKPETRLVVQAVNMPAFQRLLLSHVQGAERLYLESRRLGWHEAWASASAMDIGLSIYLNQAPQFQHMGISSNRLCMFLAMGVPVIASRQPSFQFIEDYDCGVLVSNESEFAAAVDRIASRLPEMRANALRCTREYIRAEERYQELRQRIAMLGQR